MAGEARYRIYPPETVDEYRALMEPRAGHPLSDRDCQDGINNLLGFITTLRDWQKAEERAYRSQEQVSVADREENQPLE
jgi:hypothetical protein